MKVYKSMLLTSRYIESYDYDDKDWEEFKDTVRENINSDATDDQIKEDFNEDFYDYMIEITHKKLGNAEEATEEIVDGYLEGYGYQ
jgi:hypothetical protein